MNSRLSHRPERPIVLLTFGCWVCLFVLIAAGYLSSPDSVAPYEVILLFVSLLGISGCFGWLFSWKHWRGFLITIGAAFLALFFVRFFGLFVWWQLEHHSFLEAIWQSIYITWRLIIHDISEGWFFSAAAVLFYEWLLPILQATVFVVLLWPLTRRSRGRAASGAPLS